MGRKLRRKELAASLREHGFPIGDSTLNKLCSPAINAGPPVSYWWGRTPIHDFDEAVKWAKSRASSIRKKLRGVNW